MDFRCSDTNCPAKGYYYMKEEKFKPNDFLNHIDYNELSYIINEFYRNKFINDKFKEEDFKGNNKKNVIGHYFKLLFNEDENLFPMNAKEIFHKKFPSIEINKDIDSYIEVKYREIKKIHSEKIVNSKGIFKFLDNEGNNISHIIEYDNGNNNNKKLKIVIIANDNMLNNLKDNLINKYFMDCTYKIIPPNNNNFKLMVLSGYNSTKNKTMLCLFALITNEK